MYEEEKKEVQKVIDEKFDFYMDNPSATVEDLRYVLERLVDLFYEWEDYIDDSIDYAYMANEEIESILKRLNVELRELNYDD